ncbi:hypothetical protein Tco_0407988 [Tanacetum coccineum]
MCLSMRPIIQLGLVLQETATYGKIWDNEDVHDLRSVETEFPAIVFNDTLTSEASLSCEPTVISLNNDEIDFRISFDESDDEIARYFPRNQNSIFLQIIYLNNLKTDSENDNDKVNMPLLPSPKPTVSYFDDLDFFKDFENEFPAIVYNDAQTSKSDLLTEPILNPQHIDEFNLKDETSLSEYDEEEQNVICFNDLFPFNVIYPDELKTDTDNDNDKVDIEHSSEDLSVKPLPDSINTDVGAYAHGLAFAPTKPQSERHQMAQPFARVIGPTNLNEALEIITYGSHEQYVDDIKVVCQEFEAINKDTECDSWIDERSVTTWNPFDVMAVYLNFGEEFWRSSQVSLSWSWFSVRSPQRLPLTTRRYSVIREENSIAYVYLHDCRFDIVYHNNLVSLE